MTQFKKMLSVGLVSCMAASSLMMGAGAADGDALQVGEYAKRAQAAEAILNKPEAVSVYAGDTVTGTVIYTKADGSIVEENFDVDIPADATNAEMAEMASSAARSAVGMPAARNARANRTEIGRSSAPGGGNTLNINASTSSMGGTMMFTGKVPTISVRDNWDYLEIDFFNLYGMSTLNVRAENESLGSTSPNRNCYQTGFSVDPASDLYVTFADGTVYGKGEFFITQNKNLTVYASGNVRGQGACIGYVGTYY